MSWSLRRGGVGKQPGRAVVQAGVFCLVATGCATDPPLALLTLVDPETMVRQDSEMLPDSAKAAIRTYLGRIEDSVWMDVSSPAMARLVGECRGMTAMLNAAALPGPGRSAAVIVEVPGAGLTEFRLSHVRSDTSMTTYIGQAKQGAMSILLLRDSVTAGRITTVNGVYNFRSGPFGLISVDPVDSSGTLPELHLIRTTAATPSPRFAQGAQC
jgi:hypothetical protein